jgi:hypothetical protein
VVPISSSSHVEISGFSGDMVADGACRPSLDAGAQTPSWSGRVETHGQFAAFAYTVALSLEGQSMSLNAFVKTV